MRNVPAFLPSVNYSSVNNDLHQMNYIIHKGKSLSSLTNSVGSSLWLESIEFHGRTITLRINYTFIKQLILCAIY